MYLVTNINYTNIKSCCTPETNIMLCTNNTIIFQLKKREEKEEQSWRIDTFQFLSLLQITVIKIGWCCYKDKHTDEWNKVESPEINSYTDGQMILNKGIKTAQQGKNSFFNKWCCDD